MRWKTTTPDAWSREAESSSFQIILETTDVTVLNGRENVFERRERESVE